MEADNIFFISAYEKLSTGIIITELCGGNCNTVYMNPSAKKIIKNDKYEFSLQSLKPIISKCNASNISRRLSMGKNKIISVSICKTDSGLFLCECTPVAKTGHEHIDPATGLYTRTGFENNFNEIKKNIDMRINNGENIRGGFMVINVDNLKHVNDRYGRFFGDKLIAKLADTLRALVNEGSVAATLGGATFGVFFSDITDKSFFSERMRIVCSAMNIEINENDKTSVSCGGAIYPDNGVIFGTLLENAAKAQYKASASGGNSYFLYSHSLDNIVLSDMLATNNEKTNERYNVFIRTFGYFDVFIDGHAINFRLEKAKELLALLVDRQGGYITSKEAITFLWEDEPINPTTLSRYRKVSMRLKNILEENGIPGIIETKSGNKRIVPNRIECDLYNYLSDKSEFRHLFKGSYLTNYSWSENTLADLERDFE